MRRVVIWVLVEWLRSEKLYRPGLQVGGVHRLRAALREGEEIAVRRVLHACRRFAPRLEAVARAANLGAHRLQASARMREELVRDVLELQRRRARAVADQSRDGI